MMIDRLNFCSPKVFLFFNNLVLVAVVKAEIGKLEFFLRKQRLAVLSSQHLPLKCTH